jgi:NADPH:quinone reductase-like Zn-dependent oxidoreductase
MTDTLCVPLLLPASSVLPSHACQVYIHYNYNIKMLLPGVDVVLDNIGGSYLQRNLNTLAVDGRLFIIGFMEGVVTEVNLAVMLARRLTVQGSMVLSAATSLS